MLDVAKKKTKADEPADEQGGENRSPSWPVFARLDPELKEPVEAYIAAQEYPPAIARVLEKALKELLAKHGYWPPKS